MEAYTLKKHTQNTVSHCVRVLCNNDVSIFNPSTSHNKSHIPDQFTDKELYQYMKENYEKYQLSNKTLHYFCIDLII